MTQMSADDFQTPPRILIPKLVRSRDGWKAKAMQRKDDCKALKIRVRDLAASRDRYREHAKSLQQDLETARLQLEHTQQQLQQTRLQLSLMQREHDLILTRTDCDPIVLPKLQAGSAVDSKKKGRLDHPATRRTLFAGRDSAGRGFGA